MTELYTLQDQFQNFLLNGQMDIHQSVVDTDTVPAEIRLGIYKNAYEARLLEVLEHHYPCLKAHLSEDDFYRIGLDYIHAHPSTWRSVRWFGDRLASHLSACPENDYPYLAELAEFEWKMTLSFDAPDSPLVNMEQMAAVPPTAWGEMIMIAQPSVQRMNFFWNVPALWQSVTAGETPEAIKRQPAPKAWVMWRTEYINRFQSLSADEAWAMDQMMTGAGFGKLCEGLCAFIDAEEVSLRAASLLKGWIQMGILARISFVDI